MRGSTVYETLLIFSTYCAWYFVVDYHSSWTASSTSYAPSQACAMYFMVCNLKCLGDTQSYGHGHLALKYL